MTLILSVIAGLAARHIEPQVTEFALRFFEDDHMPTADERHVLSFAAVMCLAALLLWVLGAGGYSVLLILGTTAGYFQKELRDALIGMRG